MTQISVELPDSLFKSAAALAQKEKVTLEQLITSALGEKLSALMTEDYLTQRANQGNREVFLAVWIKRKMLIRHWRINFNRAAF